jgi:hypothetical protein
MIRRLGSTLSQIEWGDLYTRDDPKHREQYELTRQVNVARLVDPVRKLNEILEGMDEALDVFAIVELGTDEVMSNGLGLCLYKNREDAEHVVELWRKQAGDDEPANAEIKEARVSSKSGLTIQSTDA